MVARFFVPDERTLPSCLTFPFKVVERHFSPDKKGLRSLETSSTFSHILWL